MKIGLMSLCLVATGCGFRAPSPTGLFWGRYGSAIECIETKTDGTYRQILIQNGAVLYDSTGKWEPRTSTDGINFYGFYIAVDLDSARAAKSPSALKIDPVKQSAAMFTLNNEGGERVLTVAPETPYFLATDNKSVIKSIDQFSSEATPSASR